MSSHPDPGPSWFARTFPVPAPSWVAPAISVALAIGAAGRAEDLLTRTAAVGVKGTGVDVAGLHVWGGLWLGLAATLLAGVVLIHLAHNRWPVLLAHAYGVALHVSYVLALLPLAFAAGRGLGIVGPAVAAGLVHLISVGLYIGPRPRPPRGGRTA